MPAKYPYKVSESQIGWTPGAAEFEPLVASILDVHATDADGFPAAFNTTMLNLANDGNEGPILDQHLTAMDFAPGALDAAVYAPVVLDTAAFHAGGDSALGEVETNTGAGSGAAGGTPPNPAPPNPSPPPAQTGGGGGGGGGVSTHGGGGGGGIGNCGPGQLPEAGTDGCRASVL